MVGFVGSIGLGLISLYCVFQAVRDFRRRAYIMAAAGMACAIFLLLVPIKSHAIKVDVVAPTPR